MQPISLEKRFKIRPIIQKLLFSNRMQEVNIDKFYWKKTLIDLYHLPTGFSSKKISCARMMDLNILLCSLTEADIQIKKK